MQRNRTPRALLAGRQNETGLPDQFGSFLDVRPCEPDEPGIPPPGIYPRKMETHADTKTYKQMFIIVVFVIAKKRKQPKGLPISEWINKLCYTHTTESYSARKWNELLTHTTCGWIPRVWCPGRKANPKGYILCDFIYQLLFAGDKTWWGGTICCRQQFGLGDSVTIKRQHSGSSVWWWKSCESWLRWGPYRSTHAIQLHKATYPNPKKLVHIKPGKEWIRSAV